MIRQEACKRTGRFTGTESDFSCHFEVVNVLRSRRGLNHATKHAIYEAIPKVVGALILSSKTLRELWGRDFDAQTTNDCQSYMSPFVKIVAVLIPVSMYQWEFNLDGRRRHTSRHYVRIFIGFDSVVVWIVIGERVLRPLIISFIYALFPLVAGHCQQTSS